MSITTSTIPVHSEELARNTDSTTAQVRRRRCRGERGEGVISTAIAVLVIAFLGVGMWAGFNALFDDAVERTGDAVSEIGTP